MTTLTIVHIAREFEGFAGAGGVKDCSAGLAKASAADGHETHLFLPWYRSVDRAATTHEPGRFVCTAAFNVPLKYRAGESRSEEVEIHSGKLGPHLHLHLVRARRFRFLPERDGEVPRESLYTYSPAEAIAVGRPADAGRGHFDFFCVNVLLAKATLRACEVLGLLPDVVHCHDGHTGLFPMLAQASYEGLSPSLARVPVLTTFHNAGAGYHQDLADLDFAAACCGVSREIIDGCLLQGRFDPLVAAGIFGHQVVWVSENYYREVTETGEDWRTGWLGHLLMARGVPMRGITNGIDAEEYSPENATALKLAAPFSVRTGDMNGKLQCKQDLLRAFDGTGAAGDLPSVSSMPLQFFGSVAGRPELPLLTFVGRMDSQKGFDLLADAIEDVFGKDDQIQLIGLGADGDPEIKRRLVRLTEMFPGRVGLAIGNSTVMANKVYAGGDFFSVNSRFEPCGLTDFRAQLMGSIPIVQECGGLVKVLDGRHGFTYCGNGKGLVAAINRALRLYRRPDVNPLRKMQRQAVDNIWHHFTWQEVLRNGYLPAYHAAIARAQPRTPYETPRKLRTRSVRPNSRI